MKTIENLAACALASACSLAFCADDNATLDSVSISDEARIFCGNPITAATSPDGEFPIKWYRGDIW